MLNASGFWIELNVTDYDEPRSVRVHGRSGKSFVRPSHHLEEPGKFFNPLLAVLITAGARLMLGLAERKVFDAGLSWVFMDTDSCAIAMPDKTSDRDFIARTRRVLEWFEPLKPYRIADPLFKLEDANFAHDATGDPTDRLEPLYCYAVSAKRYCLFNLVDGQPVLRKASAHGLGHLLPAYGSDEAPASIPAPIVPEKDLGVSRWQHDIWYRIVLAALEGHADQVDLSDIPQLERKAISRYAATTPVLLRWFDGFNAGRPYAEQVRPFGFLLALHAKRNYLPKLADGNRTVRDPADSPVVVAPYSKDPEWAVRHAFDRLTKRPVRPEQLMSYRDALAQYHLHPEAKFGNGDYTDRGMTHRRHVRPLGPIDHIGKEANKWEEQFYLGANPRLRSGTDRLTASWRRSTQRCGNECRRMECARSAELEGRR